MQSWVRSPEGWQQDAAVRVSGPGSCPQLLPHRRLWLAAVHTRAWWGPACLLSCKQLPRGSNQPCSPP